MPSPETTDMVTRCPQCSTSFRITPAQLKTAKGAVRCGSCLQIFKALDNLVVTSPNESAQVTDETEQPLAPPISTPENPPADQADSHLDFDQEAINGTGNTEANKGDDNLLISDDMDSNGASKSAAFGSDLSESFLELDRWQPESKSLFDREIKDKHDENETKDPTDESWAVNLLDELENDADDSTKVSEESHRNTPTPADNPEPPPSVPNRSTKNTGSFTSLSDDEIEAALGEPFANTNEPTIGDFDFDNLEEPEKSLADNTADADETTVAAGGLFAKDDRSEYLSNIEPAPVEMAWDNGRRAWPRKLLWAGLSLTAAIALMAQIAWFQLESLSRLEPYRDWYAAACPMLGCRLPPLSDRSQIRAYNLVIRSHPRAENALMADAILLNTAPFQQPFPELVLTFSDLQGKTLASRRFSPEEYLGGELAGRRNMPVGQPVHLSLELVDPGPKAVNYSASIP